MRAAALVATVCASTALLAADASACQSGVEDLPFPGLLAREEREAGNPLATYAALLELEPRYRDSRIFAAIYPEVRFNYEEFLGLPFSGEEAMALPGLRATADRPHANLPDGLQPRSALSVILEAAAKTRLVVFGEEHHLPQTRCLYEPLLRGLWDLGYRYLAAETFADDVMAPDFGELVARSGYYTLDPVFASAVRTARTLGYRLVAYDTSEPGPPGDGSFRDRTQARNLQDRVFAQDPQAKLLVLAGRGHAAEVPPADGWTPMASVLKELSGVDPFTIYAPTMSERRTRDEEDPLYRDATARGLVSEPTIFVDAGGVPFGSGHCDALVFWPRVGLVQGRPDWMVKTLGRAPVAVPAALAGGEGLRLVQAFARDDSFRAVPVDQVLLRTGEPVPALMLPKGDFRVRVIDAAGHVTGPVDLALADHAPELQRFEFRQVVMAVEARIVLYAPDEATAKAAASAAFHRMDAVDQACSDYRLDSDLMRLCSAANDIEDDAQRSFNTRGGTLLYVLGLARAVAEETGGAFDPTCGPLTRLWREARALQAIPPASAIQEARERSGWEKLEIQFRFPEHSSVVVTPHTIRFMHRGMGLDLGGIAKGWALDVALDRLRQYSITSTLIEFGGDLRIGDPPPGSRGWVLDAESDRVAPALVITKPSAVAVSGDSGQFLEIDGARYSHVVDPRSGWPLTHGREAIVVLEEPSEDPLSASEWHVLAFENRLIPTLADTLIPVGALADALSTAIAVLDPHAGRAYALRKGASYVRITDPAFHSLFDGSTLTGWTTRGGRYDGEAVWTVEDGAITGRTGPGDAGGLLYTGSKHTSFEFQCEVRLEYPFDSGLFVRMAPDGRGVQLTLDDRPDGEVGGLYSDGWIEHARPEAAAAWRRDEWNHLFLRCTGFDPRMEAWINGVKVMDRVVPQEFGADGRPLFAPRGLIGLQVHGGGSEGAGHAARFRDVQLRELPVLGEAWATDRALSPPERLAREAARAADGWRDLLAGEHPLAAWEAVDGEGDPRAPTDYAVRDGVLSIPSSEPAGTLRTREDFGDFDLTLRFRQARMSNSGLFLRGRRESVGPDGARVPGGNPAYSGCEIQMLDDWNWEAVTGSALHDWQLTGSLYGAVAPGERGLLAPLGEWNRLEVLARGSRLACALNGETLWDVDTQSLAVDPPFAQRARAGFLGLQRYAAPDVTDAAAVQVRDLWVRER